MLHKSQIRLELKQSMYCIGIVYKNAMEYLRRIYIFLLT